MKTLLLITLLSISNVAYPLCGNYDSVHVGNYRITNNVWNDVAGSQCFETNIPLWRLSYSNHNKPTNGPPASYPFIMRGCHWGACSVNNPFPKQVPFITSLISTWSYNPFVPGIFNASYDIWFDTTPNPGNRAANAHELMIWTYKKGAIQPVGSFVGNVILNGAQWQIWHGGIVTTYVRLASTHKVENFNLKSFIDHASNRGYINSSWYLTSVQAGFEIWQGGQGLMTNSFSLQ